MTIATNLLYNIVVARYLGPKGFGQATVVYTLLTLLSAVTLSFQIVSSKLVAQQLTDEGRSAVYRAFHRAAWACGIFVGLVLLCFRSAISSYLNLPDPWLVALLAIGAAFYVPLGPRRGFIQGTYGFRGLAINLVVEGAVRLVGSYILILAGFDVRGVIAANAAASAAAYFAVPLRLKGNLKNPLEFSYAFREIWQAVIFYSGQMLIGNCSIVLVNHFFEAHTAGLYAAIAMVGRVIFTMSSRPEGNFHFAPPCFWQRSRLSSGLVRGAADCLDQAFRFRLSTAKSVQPLLFARSICHHHGGLLS